MRNEINRIIAENKDILKNKSSKDLIEVLHNLQERYGFLSKTLLIAVAKELDISISKVYGVVSFYNLFKIKEEGKIKIEVCDGTVCHVKGSEEIIKIIKKELDIKNDLSKDRRYSLNIVRCLGLCASAPVVVVNGKVFTNVNKDEIINIINEIKKE